MTTEELVDRLSSHKTLGTAPREELVWIATHSALRQYQPGEILSRHTEVVEGLYILLSGKISISVHRGAGQQKIMEWQGGDVTGVLPYSRLVSPPGDTIVEEPLEVLALDRNELPALIRSCYEVTAMLVHVMMDRARQFTSADLRNEKLVSLGKLAAGLAHELNNPASAALRDAKSMPGLLAAAEGAARTLGAAGLTGAQLAELDRVQNFCMDGRTAQVMTGLALADREEEISSWLETRNADGAAAEDLARTPITFDALDRLAASFPVPQLDIVLRWIAAGCAVRALALDIERATTRIHGLVTSVKGFTHMDRDPNVGPLDIQAGLSDTIALLAGKARARSVAITLEAAPALPPVHGLSAEINQVWMNLVDNAIDAAPDHGHVTVTAQYAAPHVVVRVVDDGPGIPADIKDKIFDPFFTTKSVGEGTGLGLDIVRRIAEWHNARIEVESAPGRTEFRVSIPAHHP